MYNNNLRQIDSLNNALDNLMDSNNQIRNLLVQILQPTRGNNTRRSNSNLFTNTNGLLGRIMINEQPYIIDTINEYVYPRNQRNNRQSTLDSYAQSVYDSLFENFLQPITVTPTQSQIETATRRVRYCDIARPLNTSCPISMEDFTDNDTVTVIRHCGHIFHSQHLNNWFRTNCRCPVCRYDIRDFNSNVSTDFFNNYVDSSNNRIERNSNNRNSNNSNRNSNNSNRNSNNSNNSSNNSNNSSNNSNQFDTAVNEDDDSYDMSGNITNITFSPFFINALSNALNNRTRDNR
jgi:hypothetical protein